MAATVTVRGTAIVPAQPDEVELTLELVYIGKSPDVALSEVARRSEELEALFGDLGIDASRWTTSGVSVREEYEWNQKTGVQTLRGFAAENRIALRLHDAAVVGGLMSEAARRSQARINGPFWRVAPNNPARVEACGQAAADARRKAEAYASALGARLGALIEITEPGVDPPRPQPQMMAMRMKTMEADAAQVNVQAGSLEVSASVVVTFAIEQE